jgi:hypothetical protein
MKKLTAKEIAALFKEWREDYAEANREDAHPRYATTEKEAFQDILDGKTTEAPAAEKGKDRDIER